MAAFAEFVRRLLYDGSAVLRGPPEADPAVRAEAEGVLAGAYEAHRLGVAGLPLPFAPDAATLAAWWTWQACWFLVHRAEPPAEVDRRLAPPPPPRTPGEHLSADLTFRLLGQVHGRARAVRPYDVLTRRLEELLRGWPLSGVLADLGDPPLAEPEFGHPGLALLYAERLAERPKAAWLPGGAGRAYVDLVFAERGLAAP